MSLSFHDTVLAVCLIIPILHSECSTLHAVLITIYVFLLKVPHNKRNREQRSENKNFNLSETVYSIFLIN